MSSAQSELQNPQLETVAEALPVFFIKPEQGLPPLGLRELWEYRELLYFFVWRDIKVRYKQTVLGAAWAIIQPFFMMVVFSLFFGRLARVPSDGIPYPIFVYCALLPWQLFAHALSESSNSMVTNERLITKVYFPRLLVPLSSVLGGLVDFAIAFVILLFMMAWYGIRPTWAMVSLPAFVLLAMATALGVGLWLSALNVRYRDVWALLGKSEPPGALLAVSVVAVILILIGGLYYFRRMEAEFADVV